VKKLIPKYATELRVLRQQSDEKAKQIDAKAYTLGHTQGCHGSINTVETCFLYMMLRELQPAKVLEVGALCGFSTWAMLQAMKMNRKGHLVSYDLHDDVHYYVGSHSEWTFHAEDVLAAQDRDPNLVNRFDILFIDAKHDNSFSEMYTRRLLRNVMRDTPVFVHDVFSPFQIANFKPCQRSLTLHTLPDEVECMQEAARQYKVETKHDLIYSPGQPAGEGQELMSWLSRTGRSSSMFTLSPYAALSFANPIFIAFEENNIVDLKSNRSHEINNPSIFFVLKGLDALDM